MACLPYRLQSCWRWLLALAFTCPQRAHHLFHFPIKQRGVFLPADEVGGSAVTAKRAEKAGDSINALSEWGAASVVIT
jgi:hypothetical protein